MELAFWKSAIIAPVSRTVGVADVERSLAFYRHVLGFEVKPDDEVALGPASICFETPAEPAILFFETGNVADLRRAIEKRGGAVSPLQKMNLLKIEMFEVRDPDGHTIWFGESFQHPGKPADPDAMFLKGLPGIALEDVPSAIDYYRHVLGFQINYSQGDLGVVYRNEATLLLFKRTNQRKGNGSAYFYIRNADQLYAELKARGAQLEGEPVSHPWGLREFHARDLEGNTLKFGQPFE